MSKLQFRARALDNQKPMGVYLADDLPDLSEMTSMNRSVPQMPTGMEKEEESEHHLQRAISAQQVYGDASRLVIPTPEAKLEPNINYGDVYVNNVKVPKALIHMQTLGLDDDIPDYDMDSEDEEWVAGQSKSQPLTKQEFESMMDTLEKGSGNQALTLRDAQALVRADDDVVIAVYDYWLAKRLRLKRPLIPAVKTERRDGSTANDPYVAFRRRTERMQTRKNRKNDESSYEKMVKLQRDLQRALSLLAMIKMRESMKHKSLLSSLAIVEKRYELQDWSGQLYSQYVEQHRIRAPPPVPFPMLQPKPVTASTSSMIHSRRVSEGRLSRDHDDLWTEEHERHFRPSFHRSISRRRSSKSHRRRHGGHVLPGSVDASRVAGMSDAEDLLPQTELGGDMEEDLDVEGPYPFRRKSHVRYRECRHRPGVWPWEDPVQHCNNVCNSRYRYSCLSLNNRFVGFTRRRVGRGGRIWLDRTHTPFETTLADFEANLSDQTFHLERTQLDLPSGRDEFWPCYISRPASSQKRHKLFHEARAVVGHALHSEQPLSGDTTYLKGQTFDMYPSKSEDEHIRVEHEWQQTASVFDCQPTSRFRLLSCASAAEQLVSHIAELENAKEVGYHEQPETTESLDLNDLYEERNAFFRSLDKPKDQPPVDLFEDCQDREEDEDSVVVCSNGPVSGLPTSRRRDMSLDLCLQAVLPSGTRGVDNVGNQKMGMLKGGSGVSSINELMLLDENRPGNISSRSQNSLLSDGVSPIEQQPLMS
ncbi:enhancer of polycomb homolog 1-like [Corticium candelabrum]|uniref:enhancer of polycomb homolog 1-like n=1 Tax=Corticium candelabrum TaxID=121492 RepID=UPI002E260EDC|nr:enhancer of polycomb homolog 1-like [Corticium candelabrum]